jgi:uncharacterized protein with PIN domain
LARFYADENFRYPVVAALRRLGHDALTAHEAGRAGQSIDDDTVLSDALEAGRILLTQNRHDFIRRHKKGLPHQAIVVCTYDPETDRLARRIDEAVAAARPIGRCLVRVTKPPK